MFKIGKKRIYLDTASTTPIDSRVLKVMYPYFSNESGNPSSLHREGVRAKIATEQARQQIATLLSAHSDEIIFTSGGTEGDNLAILGIARGLLAKNKIKQPGHIITTAIEHQAILEPCRQLEKEGWSVTYLPVSSEGIIDMTVLKESLRPETILVSVMFANNEIGTIEPLRDIAKILREWRKIQGEDRLPYFHTDACQATRFFHFQVEKLGVDLMTLSGGKIYGPKGVGCLYLKRNTFIEPIIYGGGQENGWRSGTENVPSIIGLAMAIKLAVDQGEKETERLEKLRDYFIKKLTSISQVKINGSLTERLPNNINVTFPGILGEWLVLSLDAKGIACSTGSACSSHHKDNAYVIIALGNNKSYAESTVRFTLDRETTKKDIDYTIKILKEIIAKNRAVVV